MFRISLIHCSSYKAVLLNLTNTPQERTGGTNEPELDKWHKQFGARTGIGSMKANVELFPLALSDPVRGRMVGSQLCWGV